MNQPKRDGVDRVTSGRVGALLCAAVASGCAADVGEPGTGSATENYTVAWNPSSCTIARVLKPRLRVCVRGSGDIAHAQVMTRRGLEAWLVPLRARFENVATEVEFGCTDPDATVNIYPGSGRAYSSPRVVLGVYDQSALGTWIHEFGHAFACLGDTYVNGTAAWCQPGQPRSVMCYGLLLNDVTADDIAGMVRQAERLGFTPRRAGDPIDAGTPDASVPDVSVPDASVPDASVPDVSVPDVSVPDARVGRCGAITSCGACAPVAGCAWCGATGSCVEVDGSGFPAGACASGFALYANQCPAGDGRVACGRYAGWTLWSCVDDRTRVRCVSGSLQREVCATSCATRPVGVDDVCE